MKKILFVVILIVLFPLIGNTQDISNIINEYQRCKVSGGCKTLEIKLIKVLLKDTDILTVMDKMPTEKDIEYSILQANLSGSKKDVIVKIFIPSDLGYIFVLKKDQLKEKYNKLPVIETGIINNIYTEDITGDGLSELIIRATSHETDGYTNWIAIYKYKDMKMNRIWGGIEEYEHTNDISVTEKYDITFKKEDSGPKTIYQIGTSEKTDNVTNKIDKKKINKKFNWSQQLFKYIEE